MAVKNEKQAHDLAALKPLIDDAGADNKQVKILKKNVDAAKETLSDVFYDLGVKKLEGEVFNATASFTDQFEAIKPQALLVKLKKYGLEHRLFEAISVNMKGLKAIEELPPIAIKELQGEAVATKISITLKERG